MRRYHAAGSDALAPPPLRAVPSGPEHDTYLPLFRLADDSEEQIQGYYQMGTLLALDDDSGTPLGIVLALDGPEGSADGPVELKAVAVAASRQSQGVGRRMLDDALQWLRARGVRRVIVGTASSGTGQLAFYQKTGFRLERVERDYFTPSRGYAADALENGIPLRDMVWMDQQLAPPPD